MFHLIAAAVAVGASGPTSPPPTPSTPPAVLWLPLGDSITWGCVGPTIYDCHSDGGGYVAFALFLGRRTCSRFGCTCLCLPFIYLAPATPKVPSATGVCVVAASRFAMDCKQSGRLQHQHNGNLNHRTWRFSRFCYARHPSHMHCTAHIHSHVHSPLTHTHAPPRAGHPGWQIPQITTLLNKSLATNEVRDWRLLEASHSCVFEVIGGGLGLGLGFEV
jgi:hypothetical protein